MRASPTGHHPLRPGRSPGTGAFPAARAIVALAAAALAAGAPAAAHDFWIEPQSFSPSPGDTVDVYLRNGERLDGEAVPRRDDRIDRFELIGPGGVLPVAGKDGADPAGAVRVETPGIHVIAYRGRPQPIELQAAKFESYLREEGLEAVVDARARQGRSAEAGREVFSRCAKALLRAGDARGGHDRLAGLTLEIVPEDDPTRAAPGATLRVRTLFEGRPLPGMLLAAVPAADPSLRQAARTDAEGRAAFVLERSGLWLVDGVHMVPAPVGSWADWESLWASLTFEVPATADN